MIAQVSRILIVGAGGQGKIVADILLSAETRDAATPIGFLDDDPSAAGAFGLPVLGSIAHHSAVPHDAIVVAIGDNRRREDVSLALMREGERVVTARHLHTSVAREVEVGDGSMLSAGSIITPCARLGRGVILNTNASVDHDSSLGAFAHVSAGATVGARVTIGDRTLIGVGAAVMSGRRVGSDVVVGAGAVVVHDVPDGVVVMGVPARVTRTIG